MKKNKNTQRTPRRVTRTAVLMTLSLLLLVSALSLFFVSRKGESGDTTGETETRREPEAITKAPDEGESTAPLRFEGVTYTVLLPQNGSVYFGDRDDGDSVNKAAYEKNKAFAEETGVALRFIYSLSVFDDFRDGWLSGRDDIDLVTLCLGTDGGRFLMSGSVGTVFDSEEYLRADSSSNAINSVGRSVFMMSPISPSYITAERFLKIKNGNSAENALKALSADGKLTYEALFEALTENDTVIRLGEEGLHAIASEGRIFSFSEDGEPSVSTERYADNVKSLLSVAALEAEESDITVSTPAEKEGYTYLPLPKRDSDGEYPISYDTSFLYVTAIPSWKSSDSLSHEVLRELTAASETVPDMLRAEYHLPESGIGRICVYDIFGWGDFSRHAYNAWKGGSTDTLDKTLIAPERAALQALMILQERCK